MLNHTFYGRINRGGQGCLVTQTVRGQPVFHSENISESFQLQPLSDGYSETSASSEGNPETSSDSAPSDLNSAPMFLGDSPSRSGDKVTPTISDIKGQVVKAIRDIKGRWWSR